MTTNPESEATLAFAVWKRDVITVPIIIALEEGRKPTFCAVFPAKHLIDPVFWRAAMPTTTTVEIATAVKKMLASGTFSNKPKPSAVLMGIPADVFFAALSGRLFGDDPSDASGETAAIFRLALALLPGGVPLDDMLAVVRRFGRRAWPFLGMGRIPQEIEENERWLRLPDSTSGFFGFDEFGIKDNDELDKLLATVLSNPGGHSALRRAPLLAVHPEEETR